MTEGYAYLGQWNYSTSSPVPSHGWMSVEEAQQRFEEASRRFDVVLNSVRETQDRGEWMNAPWVLTCWKGRQAFTVNVLDAGGSIRRIVEYEQEDGRLFKAAVIEYTFPDQEQFYRPKESRLTTHGIFRPDGTGFLTVDDKSKSTVDRLSVDQIDVSSNWLPLPAFGAWEQLTNPDDAPLHRPETR